EIGMVQGVEELRTKLKVHLFSHVKLAMQCHVESLHSRTIDRVSAGIPERKCSRRRKRSRVEPVIGRPCAGTEHGFPRVIGSYRVFAQQRAGVRRVSKNGDRQRIAALRLVYSRYMPVSGRGVRNSVTAQFWEIVNQAQREAVTNVTCGTL